MEMSRLCLTLYGWKHFPSLNGIFSWARTDMKPKLANILDIQSNKNFLR